MHSGRFIPAGAGNSPSASSPALDISVYPRWRGELWFTHATSERVDGLSPLARGTQGRRYPRSATPRFIPAGAGNTIETFHAIKQAAVYPRWRGEHLLIKWRARCVYGLSPLARGTPVVRYLSKGCFRFIPAGAGNTWRPSSFKASMPVYPRWRGEHSKHNLLLINDFLSQSQSTNFTGSHKQHIHYVKEHLIH